MVLTGDCLLVGDVGRPDFGGGDAGERYESLTRLLRLPDWVAVFPGHFEGPSGRGTCGPPTTTIGFERLYNSLARLEREPFVSSLTDTVPARPLNMAAFEATNWGLADTSWGMLTFSPRIEEVSVDELEAQQKGTVLLDVREPEEYAQEPLISRRPNSRPDWRRARPIARLSRSARAAFGPSAPPSS
jgi:hydroxyacylglutathione hydrolase